MVQLRTFRADADGRRQNPGSARTSGIPRDHTRIGERGYPQLAVIVRQVALEHGIAYHSHPTIRSALRSHGRWLKRMGAAASIPVVTTV